MVKKKSGYTLIEILIVISLMGIFFTLGYAQFNRFNRRQVFVQAVEEFKSNLRLAQSKALAGEKNSGCSGKKLTGYQVGFSSSTDYKIWAVCSDSAGNTLVETKAFSLPGGITASPTGVNVFFKVLGLGVEQEKDFQLSGSSGSQTVSVSKTGEIL